MKHLTSILSFILIISFSSNAQVAKAPDFAFPQKVSRQASTSLSAALKSNDAPATIRSLMDYALAQGAIDADNIPEVIAKVDSVRNLPEVSPAAYAMSDLLLAEIYSQLYNQKRWVYDRREVSTTPRPANYAEWSGTQFRECIMTLVDSAMMRQDALQATPLREWASVISCNEDSRPCFPTLYDFTAYKAISFIENNLSASTPAPWQWLCPASDFVSLSFTSVPEQRQKIADIYRNLLILNADNSAACIYSDIQRLLFVNNNSAGTSNRQMFDALNGLYESKLKASIYSGLALLTMGSYASDTAMSAQLKSRCDQWLSVYDPSASTSPKGLQAAIRSLRLRLEQQSITADFNSVTTNLRPLEIHLHSNNASTCTINVYRLPDTYKYGDRISALPASSAPKVESIAVQFNRTGIFEADTTINLPPLTYGNYLVSVLLPGQKFNIRNAGFSDIFTVTDIAMMVPTLGNSASIVTVNPLTGAPLEGISLKGLADRTATTDANGMYAIRQGLKYDNQIYAQSGKDRFSPPLQFYHNHEKQDGKWRKQCSLFTDLAIYHPGDTVRFSGVAYEYYSRAGHASRLMCQKDMTAIMYNANSIAIDTLQCRTDDWGRLEGRFAIPQDGLTGSFRIKVASLDYGSSVSFMVSDYKLPTYALTVTETRRNHPVKGAVSITARAETYSGFPVSDANVELRLSQSPRNWWWRSSRNGEPFHTTNATTDSSGYVTFILSGQVLADAPLSNGIFTASLTSTSPSGENQDVTTSFTLGAINMIQLRFQPDTDISGKNITLPVSVTNLSGDVVEIPLTYRLKQGDSTVKEGAFSSKSPVVDWSSVKSGIYEITVMAADSTIAMPETSSDIALYRPTDRNIPRKSALWVPVTSYSTTAGTPAKVLYGTSYDDAYTLCTLWGADSILSQQWIHPGNGMHTFDVSLPEGVNSATLTMCNIHDFTKSCSQISITRKDAASRLNITIDSFRDHITPGQTEQWHLRVTDNTGSPVSSAIVLDMYSKALDALSPHQLSLQFHAPYGSIFNIRNFTGGGTERLYSQSKLGKQTYFNIDRPQFETYGRSFRPQIHIRGARMMKSAALGADMVKEEAVSEADAGGVEVAYAQAKVYNSAATADRAVTVQEIAIVNDEAVREEEEAKEAGQEPSSDQYRMPEMPLAFFKPMLTTGPDGQLEFSFTAPDANTTWKLCAAAFSKDLLTGTATREIISNKPVMVQPNMPRFLRSNDTAQIRTSVMNNTDSTVSATTITEIFDPATGAVTYTQTDTLTLTAKSARIVSCTLDAPARSPFIGFRIRARIHGFSDGEQTVLPVLPATTPVIETEPFYMGPDSTTLSVKIPATAANRRVTLQLCMNPAWYCVTALPGLRTDDAHTANSAAAAIFSAAIAQGLMRDYPAIGQAISEWNQSNRSDSTLTSMLERNQDLKTVLLNATPWMMDAQSDTERMARLALLFDSKEMDRCYSRNISKLSKLVRKGGWTWAGCYDQPSLWTTYNVLEMMGRLKQLGYLPNDRQLNSMITKAISYIDREASDTYARYPDSDFTQYTFIRGYFTDIRQTASATAVTRATVQRLVSKWRKMSLTDKATAAIILYRNNYKTVSRQVISSLDEYARTSPQKGMWWPSLDEYYGWAMSKTGATALILDAYATIVPESDRINGIRQWLILQKEAENWGTSVTTSNVIASILTSGSKWLNPAGTMTVTVDRHEVNLSPTDRHLGYVRTDITPLVASANTVMNVIKPSGTPAWGAVYSQSIQPVDSVRASGCDAVTIEKRMFTARDKNSGVEWTETGHYTVGDRIRIQLTVNTTRDMDYVTIIDDRAAAFEPRQQLPAPIVSEGIYFYQENRDESTRMFVRHLPKGTYQLTYEVNANNSGRFASGIATIQSQYAPQLTAHSAGSAITVE